MSQKILLITWGTGYIGSHAVVAFEQAGYKTVIIDNLSNSSRESLNGIQKILWYTPDFYECDICNQEELRNIFQKYSFDGVIHFAGLKAVGESCEEVGLYHSNNVWGSITLFWVMQEFWVHKIVFSSSATVYSPENISPLREDMSLATTNPYGTTKLIIEKLLEDYTKHTNWRVVNLRYFNPIGAHPSWYIGEVPSGVPNNLLPYILDVASGKREKVRVFGDDYDTPDGTWVRDYIDVCDLVDAHILAYKHLDNAKFGVYNIGTGTGTSVFEMINIVRGVTGKSVPYEVAGRRSGDIASVYCDPSLAQETMEFTAKTGIQESVNNGWKFILNAQS